MRAEVLAFAEQMDAMLTEKEDEHGEEWKQLSAEELAISALNQCDHALDGDYKELKTQRRMIHVANYAMMAWMRSHDA